MDYQTSSPVTLHKKLSTTTTSSSPKTIYDGVFSAYQPPHLPSSAPHGGVVVAADDYREIFRGSSNDSSSSSIPFLDVPELFRKTTSVDLTNKNSKSCVDYSNVFGGFRDFDGALSYEDIVAAKPPNKKKHTTAYGFVSMELEPMNTASMASPLGGSAHSDSLGGNQMKSHKESYQSFVGTKQFNMPYRKTSPGLSNGANATHIAELNAVSGYTYLVDGGSRKPTTTGDKPVSSDSKNAFGDSDSNGQMSNSNLLRKDMSRVPHVDGSEVPSRGSVKFQNNSIKNRHSSNESLFDSNEINSKENLHKESPSNLQPNLGIGRDDFKKSTIPKHRMPRTSGYEKTNGMFSPPDLDEEMDKNSVAAASAAALRLAIAKAQARIKIAKESKEKKVGLQSSVKPSFKDGFISDERKGTKVANKANWSSENKAKAQEISVKADSCMQGLSGLGRQSTTNARQVGPGFSDSLKVPDTEGPTREAPVHRIRSTPIERWCCSTDELKAEKLHELSSVRFEQADNAKGMVQSSNESIRKKLKMTEKQTDRPVEYGNNSKLIDKVCTVDKHESEQNVIEKALGPGFSDSLKVPDVEESTREEAPVQRIRSPPFEHSRCRTEEQGAEKLSELSSAQFEEADNATRMMQSSNGSIRKEVKMTEKQKEHKPVEYGNKSVNKLCTDEKSESEQKVFDKAEGHQVHDYKLNTSIEQVNLINESMKVGVTTEQEETAKKQTETRAEEEYCEKIHMLNQQIKVEKKDEHQEVKGFDEYTEVTEALEQFESKKGEEEVFEQVESKNYLDYVANREENEIVLKQTCGLDPWKEITVGSYLRKSEPPLIFEEEEGENNHIDVQWRSDGVEKLVLVNRQQIMAGKDGELHDMEQIENIWPAAHTEFKEDKTFEEEKENGSMLQQICQLKDHSKTEAATRRWVETDRTQADINLKSGDEATDEACMHKCKQYYGENSCEVQAAAQRRVEADGIQPVQADVDLKPGDEATQEVCSDQQNKQERYDNESKNNHYEIQESYMQTETREHVEVVPEVLRQENDGTVKEVSETSEEPMMKKNETKPVEQIKEPEQEVEPKRAGSVNSATEFKEQMDGISQTELGQRQQEQCKEDSVVTNMCNEWGKTNGSDKDVQVSFGKKDEQSVSEEISVDHGQCMKAAQLPCMSKESWEATKTNEEINYSEFEEKIKENNKILEETVHASQKEIEFEKRRPTEKDDAKKIGKEKEKQRIAVERAMREARERAFAEARRKIMSEARERVEKIPARTNDRSSADKATTEAKLKAERAAVERATAEARERALKKALFEKAGMGVKKQSNVNEMRRTFSSTDSQHNGSVPSSSSNDPDPLNYGVPSSSERLDGVNGESAERCKARLERHQRTAERAAKALAEKNMRDLLAQKEQQERNRLAEALDADIKRWSSGKEKNLRALLSTLQYILGPDNGWQPISLTDLVTSAAVKKAYRKATLFVHPDKLQQRRASIQQKYICEKVFDLLKEAWNRFSAEER